MKFIIAYLIVGFLFATTTNAAKPRKYKRYGQLKSFYACNYQIGQSVSFCRSPRNTTCLCSSENALATYAGCFAYDKRNKTEVVDYLVEYCEERGNVTIDKDWYEKSYQNFLEKAKTAQEIPNFNKTIPINVPFKLDEAQMQLYQEGYNHFMGNYDDSLYYGVGALGYWLLIMLFGAIFHWSKFLFPGLTKKLTFKPINLWREYVSMPATFRKKKAEEFRFLKIFDSLIPTRFESIVIFFYYVYTIVTHAINMEALDSDPVFYSKYKAQIRYCADRTGITATIVMPLVFLYAGRNNFLQWLTGWSHARFLLFHRWQARVVFIMILIHVSAKTSVLIKFDSYPSIFLQSYVAWAMVAAISLGLLIGHSWQYFRNSSYEIFLIVHHILAVLFIAGAWIHTRGADTPYAYYAATAIWSFDKLARLIRITSFGVKKAKVELISDEVLKVTVPRPRWWKPFPGSYAYIYFLKPTTFWQSHPFTIIDSVDDANTLTFCIKIKRGITHGICQQLVKKTNQMDYFHVLIEGPYSRPHSGRHFENLVMLSTGTGIPGPYYTALDLIRKNDNSTKHIKFYWIIRDVKSINWFLEELCKLEGTIVETVIYICNTNTNFPFLKSQEMSKQFDSDAEKVSYSSDYLKHRLQFVDFRYGRPSIREIVHQEVKEARNSIGFITCGAPQMVDHARMTIVDSLKHDTSKRVELFEDFQEW